MIFPNRRYEKHRKIYKAFIKYAEKIKKVLLISILGSIITS